MAVQERYLIAVMVLALGLIIVGVSVTEWSTAAVPRTSQGMEGTPRSR